MNECETNENDVIRPQYKKETQEWCMANEDGLENQAVGQSGFQTSTDFDDMIVEDEEIEGNVGGETLEAKQIPDVPQPSKHERIHHKLLHMPYRTWCSHCVKGRGMATQHRRIFREDKRGVKQITIDYFSQPRTLRAWQ